MQRIFMVCMAVFACATTAAWGATTRTTAAHKASGAVKEATGKAVGNDRLRAKGAAEKAAGTVQNKLGKAQDKLGAAIRR